MKATISGGLCVLVHDLKNICMKSLKLYHLKPHFSVKLYLLITGLGSIFASCADENIEPGPQFQLFADKTLKFEYSYNYDHNHWPMWELNLSLVDGLEINDRLYTAFAYSDGSKSSFGDDSILDYNFLPIRYERGLYYEYRCTNEVVILKDKLKQGDTWTSEFQCGDEIITYTFEVVEKHETYNEFGVEYADVFQVREIAHTDKPGSSGAISMHYYNKEKGIVRREMPMYVSGTFGPMFFNRIE